MTSQKKFALLPLGGCGEIGMNMTVLFADDEVYFIDCGSLFPDQSQVGIDLVLPGYSYLTSAGIKPKAWLITHGHEDHIGGLPYFFQRFPAPIYSSEFAIKLIEAKFTDLGIQKYQATVWRENEVTKIGKIKVTPYLVNHSIPHAMGLLVETPHGCLLHTGDFRIDAHPAEELTTDKSIENVVRGKQVDVMMSDSTNSFVSGTDLSEQDLVAEFEKIMTESTGAVVVASFSSNIWRAQTIVNSAKKSGRGVHLLGRGTKRNYQIAKDLKIVKDDGVEILDEKDLRNRDRKSICILSTGSQGEAFSGLHRLAYDSVPYFKLESGDVAVFSARAIPGNEKAITFLTNQLCRRYVKVIHARDADIHVSGHGFQDDLVACIKAAKPKYFMPVHGEFRHLQKHIELAQLAGVQEENCVLAENGCVVTIEKSGIAVTERVSSNRSYVCQGGIFVDEGELYRDRTQLARNGLVVLSFVMPRSGYKLFGTPQVLVFGVPIQEAILNDEAENLFEKAVSAIEGRKDASDELLAEEMRIGLRRYIETLCRFRCLVRVVSHRV